MSRSEMMPSIALAVAGHDERADPAFGQLLDASRSVAVCVIVSTTVPFASDDRLDVHGTPLSRSITPPAQN